MNLKLKLACKTRSFLNNYNKRQRQFKYNFWIFFFCRSCFAHAYWKCPRCPLPSNEVQWVMFCFSPKFKLYFIEIKCRAKCQTKILQQHVYPQRMHSDILFCDVVQLQRLRSHNKSQQPPFTNDLQSKSKSSYYFV